MTDTEPFTTDGGLTIRRLDHGGYQYEILAWPSGRLLGRVGWISLRPSGVPLAFGDAPAELQLGGDATKRIEWADAHGTDETVVVATGARLYLGDHA